jgi:hypothetical protein
VPGNITLLSASTTVDRYKELAKADDRAALGRFIVERFDERYFLPVCNSNSKHGFTLMAIACLVIETLESFYQGRADTKRMGKKMFREFFNRNNAFCAFAQNGDWFYTDIRCGILHQAETCRGWKIRRNGALLNSQSKTINATEFLSQLKKAVKQYATEIQSDDALWENFLKKMDAICTNCH